MALYAALSPAGLAVQQSFDVGDILWLVTETALIISWRIMQSSGTTKLHSDRDIKAEATPLTTRKLEDVR